MGANMLKKKKGEDPYSCTFMHWSAVEDTSPIGR